VELYLNSPCTSSQRFNFHWYNTNISVLWRRLYSTPARTISDFANSWPASLVTNIHWPTHRWNKLIIQRLVPLLRHSTYKYQSNGNMKSKCRPCSCMQFVSDDVIISSQAAVRTELYKHFIFQNPGSWSLLTPRNMPVLMSANICKQTSQSCGHKCQWARVTSEICWHVTIDLEQLLMPRRWLFYAVDYATERNPLPSKIWLGLLATSHVE
jgi:hypothetical protein